MSKITSEARGDARWIAYASTDPRQQLCNHMEIELTSSRGPVSAQVR
jgi:hypothetical protein